MPFSQRTLDPSTDLTLTFALADHALLGIPHVADWPYRFSSWGLDDLQNTQVWLDGNDNIVGWAVMQTPFWAIDCIAHPNAPLDVYETMLDWAKQRAADMQQHSLGRPMWFLSIAAQHHPQRQALERQGFVDISDAADDPWSKVLFALATDPAPPSAKLPDELHIRSLNPNTEIEEYVALHREVFGSENMTVPWRRRTTQAVGYNNALDLVVAADNGDLHGFCIAWLRHLAGGKVADGKVAGGEIVGQIEPLGVRESMRGRGLSHHLLTESIQRLRGLGATRIFVETDKQRTEAMAAYQALGFRVAHDVCVYRFTL